MKVGLFLNSQAPLSESGDALTNELIEQVRTAREAGFQLIATGQHYLADYIQLQQIPLLSRLAAEAGSMSVATGINLLPLHHPIEIAEQISTINTFTDEVIVGVGGGYRDIEFESFGIPKSERGPRLEEGIRLMNRLWTEENVSFEGDYYAVDDVTINPRPREKPPVWVAANAEPAVRRAARVGDAWFANPHSKLSELKRSKTVYDEVRRRSDKDMAIPVFREAFVAPTSKEAKNIARPFLASKYERYLEWGQDEAMADGEDLKQSFEQMAKNRFIIGSPDDVCAEIERYRRELDASHMLLRVRWPGLPQEETLKCIEYIGDEVISRI